VSELTDMEVKTLRDLASGLLIKQIAHKHEVTHSAIDHRLIRIKKKLKAKTLFQCVYLSTKAGLICALITINLVADDNDLRRAPRRPVRYGQQKELVI
jgi:predicted RNA polymerase sigma factor